MKTLVGIYSAFLSNRSRTHNFTVLLRFLFVLILLVAAYSTVFRMLMQAEGRDYSLVTGIYWTLTVMSTLGLGDITFSSDAGRLFSIVVLLTGTLFLLVMLPFLFIQFVYVPWMESQSQLRAPRKLPENTSGHVVIVHDNPVSRALISRLKQQHVPYVMLVPELNEALRLHDQGLNVVYGDLDNPETYRKVRVEQAAMVAASAGDEVNTHVAFSVREVNSTVPIAAQARNPASVDIMQLAGCSHVIQLDEKMGQGLCRRTIGNDGAAHIVAVFGRLVVAEATAQATTLVGKSLRESGIRNDAGMGVVGIWERGKFRAPSADVVITESMVLVMAGSRQQIQAFNERFTQKLAVDARVVVIGGGRVGRATGRALAKRGVAYRIVEKLPDRPVSGHEYVLGDAAELEVLQKAGIEEASTVIITTRDDNINVYLAIYCRKLRPDILIVSRATFERNVSALHRAGADFVLSYASMGAGIMFNVLSRRDVYILDEELGVFSVQTPPSLVGRRLDESRIAEETNCRVVSINRDMEMMVNPEPSTVLEAGVEMILLASMAAEQRFRRRFVTGKD